MLEGLQNTAIKNMADYGCYFLCLCEISERITGKHVDVLQTAIMARRYDWISDDFTVNNPGGLVAWLTNKRVTVTKKTVLPNDAKYYVEKWHNPRTGYSHFRLHDWDSLQDSVTVKEGKVESYRIVEIK